MQLSLPGIEIRPTVAMAKGESTISQCAGCGSLVCTGLAPITGACPCCGGTHWWEQDCPSVGPFVRKEATDA